MSNVLYFAVFLPDGSYGPAWTGQLVMLTLPPGGEVGHQTNERTDPMLSFASGTGEGPIGGPAPASPR